MQSELQFLLRYVNSASNSAKIISRQFSEHPSPDWDSLLQTAVKHGVMPLLYLSLNQAKAEIDVPEQFTARLRLAFQRNISHSLRLTGELFNIINHLRETNLRVIPFKGPVLSFMAYGDIVLRQSGDIDLLVQRERLSNIEAVLEEHGYQRQHPYTVAQEKRFLQVDCQHVFYNAAKDMTIDLHWEFAPSYWGIRLNTDELWARAQPTLIEDTWLECLAPEDNVLILALSAAKDLFNRLVRLNDLAGFIQRHPDLAWPVIVNRANATGISRMLEVSLCLIAGLWHIPLPEAISNRIKNDHTVQALARQAQKWLLQQRPAQGFSNSLLPAKLMNSRQNQLKFYARLALTPTLEDWQATELPESLALGYYLLRPLRLARKYLLHKK